MDLDEVGTFVSVIQAGSMHGAAKLLGVPRSTVSRRVARLEDLLGVRLLSRTTRTMTLTAEGAAYFERVQPALRAIRDASEVAKDFGTLPRGTLRVSAPVDLAISFLPEAVATFLAKYPDVRIDIDVSNRRVDLVQEGFDLALRAGVLADSSLVSRLVGSSHFITVASPKYLARRRAPSKPADLAKHECLVFRAVSAAWKFQRAEGEIVEVTVNGRLIGNDLTFLRRMAIEGYGISMAPTIAVANDLESGELVRVLPDWRTEGSSVHAVMPPGRHVPVKVRAFVDHVIEHMPSGDPQPPAPKKPLSRARR